MDSEKWAWLEAQLLFLSLLLNSEGSRPESARDRASISIHTVPTCSKLLGTHRVPFPLCCFGSKVTRHWHSLSQGVVWLEDTAQKGRSFTTDSSVLLGWTGRLCELALCCFQYLAC